MNYRRTPVCLLLGAIALFGAAETTHALSLVRSENLAELVDQSGSGLRVRVVEVRYDYDAHELPSTFLTLRVEDAVYGDDTPAAGETIEIKLFGAPVSMSDGLRIHVDGTPDYRPGESYLLLLLERSEWGFTNTAGLMFGAFRIRADAEGRPLAESVGGNRWTFGDRGLSNWLADLTEPERAAVADPLAPVPYSLLRRAVTDLRNGVGGKR